MHNPSSATTNDAFTFPVSTPTGTITVPRQGTLRINGQDAKTLLADYDFDGQHLVYSTSELMTHLRQGNQDIALLHGRPGEDGETALSYPSQPTVHVISGAATSTYSAGVLSIDYVHNGLTEVQVSGGGRPALTVAAGRRPDRRHLLAAEHQQRSGSGAWPGTGAHRGCRRFGAGPDR